MRFRFVHAADLHLDTPFTGMHRVDPRLAATLRDATTQAFARLVDETIARGAAFLVIAGDVYDGPDRGVRAQLAFRDGLERLSRAGIPSFIVHGNHDPVHAGWSAVRRWPDGVTVFGASDVTAVPVVRDGTPIALVHGISYARREVTENLALRFCRAPDPCFQVGVLHCNAGANSDHAPYSPCTVEDLAAAGLDYWALGHVHLRQFLRQGSPWIAYPGNLQGLSPKPSERGAKGALFVEVDGTDVAAADFVPLDVVRFDEFGFCIDGIPDVAGAVDALTEAALDRAATHDGRVVVLRAVLTGRGPVHRDLRRTGVRDGVLVPARAALAAASASVWLDAVEDRTGAELDIAAIRARGDFASDLVRTVDSALAVEAERAPLLAAHLDQLPRGEMRRLAGDALDEPPSAEEIRAALELALDRVTETG